ncbi:MAG: FlgD immunoglobulin-like domain containing protein [Chloroherpetonaceae bacterium]|nr:FlgD immunoglobulin-like domain containing protein [Chloroherpetonaceae bacterium]
MCFTIQTLAQGVPKIGFEKLLLSESFEGSIGSNSVFSMAFDTSEGKIWFVTRSGLKTANGIWSQSPFFRNISFTTSAQNFNLEGIQTVDVLANRVWASSSKISEKDGVTRAGDGLIYSMNGGTEWTVLPQPLDKQTDTLEPYGINQVSALPIIVPEQNIIYDIAIGLKPGTVWVATWSGGIRRTQNNGQKWQRMMLPPTGFRRLSPTDTVRTKLEPRRGEDGDLTFLGFSVLQAQNGDVWVGTVDGICRTREADSLYPSWEKFTRNSTEISGGGITGNWIIALKEQPATPSFSRAIWAATWQGQSNTERFGVSWTRDDGLTWSNALIGERIYDFAFKGDTVFATGTNGLFISYNGGATWINQRVLRDQTNPKIFTKPKSEFQSVLSVPRTPNSLSSIWVGTTDGTGYSLDGGQNWSITRANIPTSSKTATYAYPNPFSPRLDRLIRIRFNQGNSTSATIHILDFSMKKVKTIYSTSESNADAEVTWDGRTENGARVANGVYFYQVDIAGGNASRGKILIID